MAQAVVRRDEMETDCTFNSLLSAVIEDLHVVGVTAVNLFSIAEGLVKQTATIIDPDAVPTFGASFGSVKPIGQKNMQVIPHEKNTELARRYGLNIAE